MASTVLARSKKVPLVRGSGLTGLRPSGGAMIPNIARRVVTEIAEDKRHGLTPGEASDWVVSQGIEAGVVVYNREGFARTVKRFEPRTGSL